jgi:hypothetical protein
MYPYTSSRLLLYMNPQPTPSPSAAYFIVPKLNAAFGSWHLTLLQLCSRIKSKYFEIQSTFRMRDFSSSQGGQSCLNK